MRLPRAASGLFVTLILLSGCTGGGAGGADDDIERSLDELDLDATETTGIIRGVVVDAAIVPLAGVTINVRSVDANLTTETKEDGLFGFDGLKPGEYFVSATKAGYGAVQTSASVVAGVDDPPIVKIRLEADPSLQPYFEERVYEAFIGCSVTSPTVSVALCDVLGPVKEATNNEFLVTYEVTGKPWWIQSEAIWDSSQPTGDDLSLSLTDFSSGPQRTVADARGKSPIYFGVNRTVAEQYGYEPGNNTLTIRLFSTTTQGTDNVDEETFQGPYRDSVYPALNGTGAPQAYEDNVVGNDPTGLLNNPFSNPECLEDAVLFNTCFDLGGIGLVVNQRVTVFTHVFYGYTPPEGWRFSEDQEVPRPDEA